MGAWDPSSEDARSAADPALAGGTLIEPATRGRSLTSATPAALATLVFAIVLAARALLVARRGSPLPYLDSWEALFEHALVPWAEGRLDLRELLHPHFEHTILWTKLIALSLATLGGGAWHNSAQLYVNAALYAATFGLVALFALPGLAGRSRVAFAAALAVIGSVPYGWANALWELQNCWFILVGLTIVALRGALAAPSSRWSIAGCAASFALPFSLAPGIVGVVAAAALRMLYAHTRLPRGTARSRAVLPWIAAVVFAIIVQAFTATERPPASMSPTLASITHALGLLLSWPLEGHAAIVVLSFLPWLAAAATTIARRDADHGRWFTIALGAWLLLLLAGFATLRSAEVSSAVPHRYKELLALGVAMNVGCLLMLRDRLQSSALRAVASLWAVALVVGVALFGYNPDQIASRFAYQQQMRENIREYYRGGDSRALERGNLVPFPYASTSRFAALLDRPGTRRLLAPALEGN